METKEIFKKYVEPIGTPLIGPAIVFKPVEEQLNFKQKIADIVRDTTDDILKEMLWDSNWLSRLVGSWLIFIKNKIEFTDDICKIILQRRFEEDGCFFALAKFGTLKCSEVLSKYLEEELYFEKIPNEGFQDTAMHALLYIDNKNKTEFTRQFLEPGGLWTKFFEFQCLRYQKIRGTKWVDFDENYKNFVRIFDFMNTLLPVQ